MTKRNWLWVFVVAFLGWGVLAGWLMSIDLEKKATAEILAQYPDRGLPRINIELDGVSLEEINEGLKETKYEGNELTLYDGADISSFEDVEVKGRGNSTWTQPKKPYQIKFKRGVDLLGMGKNKKWVFLANYLDVSSIRNDVAMILAEMLGEEYNVRGEFVELYFGGEYEGVYYVLPRIEIAKNSVGLREPDGVLFELDTLHMAEGDCHWSYWGDCLRLKGVVSGERESEQAAMEFVEDFRKLEMAAEQGNYDEVMDLIDVDSFVKYFLINEFTVNPDAYTSSFYLYKDGTEDKIHAGPVWDFDFALGNHNWSWQVDESFFSPEEEMVRKKEVFSEDSDATVGISKLFYHLDEMPEFKKEIVRIFGEKMSGRGGEFVKKILATIDKVGEALKADNEKWETGDFENETRSLMDWILKRYEFFERLYGDGKYAKRVFL